MDFPKASKIGRTLSTTASSPPIMIAIVAFTAPISPPLTGASRNLHFFASTICANSFDATGETELMSITTEFSFIPAKIPFSSSSTDFPIEALGSIVIITLLFCATSFGEEAGLAPAFSIIFTAVSSISYTMSSKPAFSRFLLIGLPIIPSPINPIFMLKTPAF